MTKEEIIDGLEIYTVGRLNKSAVHITVEELQKFIDGIKTLEQEPCDKCEVGNPCLYCKHEFEPQERSDKECKKYWM